jgi:hypothetical protein
MAHDPLIPNSDRAPDGRFAKGNKGGPGNPFTKKVNQLRSALLRASTPKDVKEVMAALLKEAKAGDVAAAKEWLDRTVGKAPQAVAITDAEGESLGGAAMMAVVLEVLSPHPDIKAQVAARLMAMAGGGNGSHA